MSVKEKLSRYKLSDWLTLVIGLVLAFIQILRYAKDSLGDTSTEVVVAGVWLLLILAPKTINDILRKIKGLKQGDE